MRIGFGYDLHRLVKGRKLIIGGIELKSDLGLLGHSDADVLLHAICDALLGAAGLGDIGEHFPDTDLKYKNISSLKLLEETNRIIIAQGFEIENVDCIIFAQAIKITPYKTAMKEKICSVLGLGTVLNIKAKTMEETGPIGNHEAIAASCAVLLKKKS